MPRPRFSFRSPLTYILLILLRSKPLPSHILAVTLDMPSNYVSSYLCYLRKIGLVERDQFNFWYLSDLGHQFIFSLENSLENVEEKFERLENYRIFKLAKIIKKNARKTQKKCKRNSPANILNNILNSKKFEKIVLESEKRLGRGLTEVEYAILKYLWEFEQITGRKYWWPPERNVSLAEALAEELRISSINAVSAALRELESKGIIYLTYDRRKNVPKVRIDKSMVKQ